MTIDKTFLNNVISLIHPSRSGYVEQFGFVDEEILRAAIYSYAIDDGLKKFAPYLALNLLLLYSGLRCDHFPPFSPQSEYGYTSNTFCNISIIKKVTNLTIYCCSLYISYDLLGNDNDLTFYDIINIFVNNLLNCDIDPIKRLYLVIYSIYVSCTSNEKKIYLIDIIKYICNKVENPISARFSHHISIKLNVNINGLLLVKNKNHIDLLYSFLEFTHNIQGKFSYKDIEI